MIDFRIPKDIGAAYQREIAGKPLNKVKFYVGLVAATVVLFVIFGIRPLAVTAAQNVKLYRELREIKEGLQTKTTKIDRDTQALSSLSSQVDLLYKRLPEGALLEEYLRELVLSSAKAGFVIERFRQQEGYEQGNPVEVGFTGNLGSLPDLIAEIENGQRFAEIKSIKTAAREGSTDVTIVLVVYSL